MPELPEVETVARTLRARVVGRTVAAVETSGLALRRPVDGRALRRALGGARVESVERRGKYLVLALSSSDALVVHLGMSGQLLALPKEAPRAPHTHLVLSLAALDRPPNPAAAAAKVDEVRYVDARRFGLVQVAPGGRLDSLEELAALGPDPLADGFTAFVLGQAAHGSRRAIKELLLDQRRIAGLGNIYASEALFVARVSPRRRAGLLGPTRLRALHGAIREVLTRAVDSRGTSLRDYVDGTGARGENQHNLLVYGREGEPCRRCGALVRRLVQGARSTFYCPRCQT